FFDRFTPGHRLPATLRRFNAMLGPNYWDTDLNLDLSMFNDNQKAMALLIQLQGDAPVEWEAGVDMEVECNRCIAAHGTVPGAPFARCLRVEAYAQGACGCCVFSHRGHLCNFHILYGIQPSAAVSRGRASNPAYDSPGRRPGTRNAYRNDPGRTDPRHVLSTADDLPPLRRPPPQLEQDSSSDAFETASDTSEAGRRNRAELERQYMHSRQLVERDRDDEVSGFGGRILPPGAPRREGPRRPGR
ncbi:MAG: hypothetical protein Q9202_007508, partial [Teloschistes flavicans]